MKQSKNNNQEKEGEEDVLQSSLQVLHWQDIHWQAIQARQIYKYSSKSQRREPQKKDSMNDFCFMYILTS